jgi:iron complex outermembrane receptor protein
LISVSQFRSGRNLPSFTSVAAFIVSLLFTTPAAAQSGSAGAMLEEIVTTARKKSSAELVQEVPITITAFGASQLDVMFVKKVDDLSYLMPNVQLDTVGTFPGVQNFSIRGQGINSSIPSVDPTVGVFVDGVFLGTSYGVVLDTFDLESVEVLRGPQGMLFGRNVTGGAVILRNARPTGEFGFRARVGATDQDQFNVAAALEGSLVEDKLAAKIVVLRDEDDGYYPNPTVGKNVGQMTTTLIRPMLTWTPTDSSNITLIYETGKTDGDGAAWTVVSDQRSGTTPFFTTTANDIGFTDITWDQATLDINIDLGRGTLTNILGYRKVDAQSAADIDGRAVPIFFVPGTTGQDQISNELRWSGLLTDKWETTVGLYYFDQDITYRESRFIAGGALLRALGGDMEANNIGVFWNNELDLNDSWTMTAGVRYTDEKKDAQIITSVNGVGCDDVVDFDCTFDNLSGDWQNVTPKLGLKWSYNDSSNLYGYFSRGYRSGGFNFRNASPDIIPPGPTREEENSTFEVGIKTDLADGRVRLNVAAFHNTIKDAQRELNVPDPDPAGVVVLQATINAGDITIKGFEADLVALLTDNFSINVSYGWMDGEYDSIDPSVPIIEADLGLSFPIIGGELPRLAPTNYSIGFSWDIPAGSAGLFNIAANHSFREAHFFDDSNINEYEDQKRTNASINWFTPNDKWQVSLYGKNLGDDANWGNLTTVAGAIAGPMKKGRILGLEVNYRY